MANQQVRRPGLGLYGPLLVATHLFACSGADGGETDDTSEEAGDDMVGASTGGDAALSTGEMGDVGAPSTGSVGGPATGGVAETGGAPAGTGGDAPTRPYADQAALDAGQACLYSNLSIDTSSECDPSADTSFVSRIDTSVYEGSGGSQFTVNAENLTHLVLSWQPPGEKPDIVDFDASISYPVEGGAERHFCFSGRLVDAYQYPVEPYYTFFATSVFEANPDGSCTSTLVTATISGCLSENYNL